MSFIQSLRPVFLLISLLTGHLCALGQTNTAIYTVKNSTTYFHSNAKFELIKAESSKLKGAIDAGKRTFAFSVDINSFDGFNSPLQKEHFNENYMETDRFPTATFTGRIVEDDDFTKDGTYNVRAKGKFTIHGVEQERIIQGDLVVKNGVIKLKCRFTVILAEHDIKIPRIVHEKLASEILVEINAEFSQK
jgi:polyisoprenoid-binding protein YceI